MRTRTVFRIRGKERVEFLQNLVTNDVNGLSEGLVWTALLTPQGKYLADFFLVPEDGQSLLLDVDSELATGLAQRANPLPNQADPSDGRRVDKKVRVIGQQSCFFET